MYIIWIWVLLVCTTPLHAAEVAAVLSSESPYYREAFRHFQKSYGHEVTSYILGEGDLPSGPETKVIVTFGSRAAKFDYKGNPKMVHALSLGFEAGRREEAEVLIQTIPSPDFLISSLKRIQPDVKKVAVFYVSDTQQPYLKRLEERAFLAGVQITVLKLENQKGLPKGLRTLTETPDALWLPPDLHLIRPENLAILDQYSHRKRIPIYVPTAGLLEHYGTASVFCPIEAIAHVTAETVRRLLSGKGTPLLVYPEEGKIAIGRKKAEKAGLFLSPKLLQAVDRILP